jgi:4'-phosphopantetheinyl transferase
VPRSRGRALSKQAPAAPGGWSIPALLPGECQVWWAAPTPAYALLACLDECERKRLAELRRHEDRARYLAAHALLRILLSAWLGKSPAEIPIERQPCRRCGAPHGKPRVRDGEGLEFSVSHSGGAVGLALSRRAAVGLDVEDLRRPVREIWDLVLSDTERPAFDSLMGTQRHRALMRCFTQKEAVFKATGDGLTVPMRALTMSAPEAPPRVLAWEGREELAHAARLVDLEPAPGHAGSLAILGEDLVVRERRGDPLLHRLIAETRSASASAAGLASAIAPARLRPIARGGAVAIEHQAVAGRANHSC